MAQEFGVGEHTMAGGDRAVVLTDNLVEPYVLLGYRVENGENLVTTWTRTGAYCTQKACGRDLAPPKPKLPWTIDIDPDGEFTSFSLNGNYVFYVWLGKDSVDLEHLLNTLNAGEVW